MNNIEILKELIDKVDIYFEDNIYFDDGIGDCAIPSKIARIIKNLIQENKEMKEKVNRQQEQLNIANKKILAQKGQLKVVNNSYIPKSKIKEIIGELEKQEDWYIEHKSLDDLYEKIDILQKLLEEGE